MKLTPTIEPFSDNLAFLKADSAFWVAKAARIEAERLWEPDPGRKDTIGQKATTHGKENQRKLLALTIADAAQKAELDARLEATRAAGTVLGIDMLCNKFRLGEVETVTLLLCVYAVIDEEIETNICRCAPATFGVRLSPDIVWSLLELDFCARAVEGRKPFAPTAPLLLNNLITLTLGRDATPYDLRSGHLCITQRAFDTIVTGASFDAKSEN